MMSCSAVAYAILVAVHLVPADRASRRVIDAEKVCEAIAALGGPGRVSGWSERVSGWSERFMLLADPNRLCLLLAIQAAGPISVSDLAVATGMNDTTASQALRLLRAHGLVTSERDGRVVRYRLADLLVADLLARVGSEHPPLAVRGH
jgi:DNA-binding transcriptional ArsR family regulator